MACRAEAPTPKPRNLVLILIDTLRQDRLSAYGYERVTSPFIDRLAREGALLDGRTTASWTKPAATSLLTGLHPLRHQVATGNDTLPLEAVTLAEILAARGFSTAAISSNGWVSRAWGQDRGFGQFLPLWTMGYGRFPKAPDVNGEVARVMPSLRPPFFLFVHYLDPHMPYDPPTAWDGGPLPPELAQLRPLGRAAFDFRGRELPLELAQAASELYDGEVRAADQGIEQLVSILGREQRLDGTLLVITSDHGEEFRDHGQMGHGKTLYEEVVRVPLIFHGPGLGPGLRLGRASLEDVAPTVLDLLGVQPALPNGYAFDGRSLARELSGGLGDSTTPAWLGYLEGEQGASLAFAHAEYKVVLARDPYRKELYQLAEDPAERVNLLAGMPEFGPSASAFGKLAGRLAEEYNRMYRRGLPRRSTVADAGLRDQLAALGYLKMFADKGVKRAFPRRLFAADARDGGLRGWENISAFVDCAEVSDLPEDQLLEGWYAPEAVLRGRWTGPEASVAFRAASGSGGVLTLEGVAYRPAASRLTLAWNGDLLTEQRIGIGPYSVTVPLQPETGSGEPPILSLRIAPPFRPSEIGSQDERVLGLFVTSICRSGMEPVQRR